MLEALVAIGIALLLALLVRYLLAKRKRWEVVDDRGVRTRLPAPPKSVPGENDNQRFTTATMAELKKYLHGSLPAAGWTLMDVTRVPAGTAVVFCRGDSRMQVVLGTDIDLFRGRPLRTRLTVTLAAGVGLSSLEEQVIRIRRLGEGDDGAALEKLLGLLEDSRAKIRREAVDALTKLDDERAAPALLDMVDDDDGGVRQRVALALGQLRTAQAVPALLAGLAGEDAELNAICAWGLGRIQDPRAVAPLIEALERPYWKLKAHAALALGELGDDSAAEALEACLKETANPQNRLVAYLSLRKLVGPAAASAILAKLPPRPGAGPDPLKTAVAESVAEAATEITFDLLDID
ncbi:MAG: HEAT repeat domain-containing protein [Thermoanaerobaculia bacterium]|nr:HEAT repeat domain-containing protein [Thermoanaerobaculia bacterium]